MVRQERTCERTHRRGRWLLGLLLLGATLSSTACAMQMTMGSTQIQVQSQNTSNTSNPVAAGLELVFLLTLVSLLPTILIVMTSFTRIVIVLSFVRTAIGVPQLPPNQVLIGLSLFLTVFVMAPTWQAINRDALQPYLRGEIDQRIALDRGLQPLRDFMFRQTRERDIALFMNLGNLPRPRNPEDVPTWVLVPAFILSELKTAFTMGFVLFIPFLVIDLIVSSTLMAMGMILVPPVVISLPFKLLLFVMVDGWDLLVRSLVTSFGTG